MKVRRVEFLGLEFWDLVPNQIGNLCLAVIAFGLLVAALHQVRDVRNGLPYSKYMALAIGLCGAAGLHDMLVSNVVFTSVYLGELGFLAVPPGLPGLRVRAMLLTSAPAEVTPDASVGFLFGMGGVALCPEIASSRTLRLSGCLNVDAGVLRTTLTERAGRIDAATLKKVHATIESGKAIGKSVLVGF